MYFRQNEECYHLILEFFDALSVIEERVKSCVDVLHEAEEDEDRRAVEQPKEKCRLRSSLQR